MISIQLYSVKMNMMAEKKSCVFDSNNRDKMNFAAQYNMLQ